jgi:hypothetical protein
MRDKEKLLHNTISNILELMPPDKKEMTITIGDYETGEALQVDVKLSYKKIRKGDEKNGKINNQYQ